MSHSQTVFTAILGAAYAYQETIRQLKAGNNSISRGETLSHLQEIIIEHLYPHNIDMQILELAFLTFDVRRQMYFNISIEDVAEIRVGVYAEFADTSGTKPKSEVHAIVTNGVDNIDEIIHSKIEHLVTVLQQPTNSNERLN